MYRGRERATFNWGQLASTKRRFFIQFVGFEPF